MGERLLIESPKRFTYPGPLRHCGIFDGKADTADVLEGCVGT
jgi:hypothetical protein